ncbi:MAG TPA: hypothetical protein VGD40_02600 [Chryseosolibacter sp.]
MIDIKKHSQLDNEVDAQLRQLINAEFGSVPVVRETEWAIPDWTLIKYDGRE